MNENNVIIYVLPKIGSSKAEELALELPFNFTVAAQAEIQEIEMLIAFVNESDLPVEFGYQDEMAFGNRPYHVTKLHLDIVVGNVHFDDLNTTVTFSARKSGEPSFHRNYSITNGQVSMWLPKKYDDGLDLLIQHWGQDFEISLAKDDFYAKESIEISFEHREKKLKSTTRYVISLNSTEQYFSLGYQFRYDPSGKLIERTAHQIVTPGTEPVITGISQFSYDVFGRMSGIDQKNPDGQIYGYENYFYDEFNRVSRIKSNNSEVAADLTAYFIYNSDQEKYPKSIQYIFPNGPVNNYKFRFEKGNLLHLTNSNVDEVYDKMINPYASMNFVDFYLRFSSKNNVVKNEQVSYAGGFPDVVPDTSVYTYDQDGYPVEKRTSIKGYTTGNLLYYEKTVFEYWD